MRETTEWEIRKFLADGERGESWGGMTGRQVAKMVTKYFVRDGALWRKRMAGRFQKVVQGVGRRYELMKAAHDEMGHKGVFAVKARLQDCFWWPKMNEDISWYIQTCHACQTRQMRKIHTPPCFSAKLMSTSCICHQRAGSPTLSKLVARYWHTPNTECYARKLQMRYRHFCLNRYCAGGG